MRGKPGRNKNHFIEMMGFPGRFRDQQMTVVDRIKGTAEQGYSHAAKTIPHLTSPLKGEELKTPSPFRGRGLG